MLSNISEIGLRAKHSFRGAIPLIVGEKLFGAYINTFGVPSSIP